ncbi:MAG: hypothetical protein RBT81_11015 [Gammaproteobacteria bacterium]|jgi:hypothetical protein|nr:hypothetical protein [Gammaproteobacteria bacterium]
MEFSIDHIPALHSETSSIDAPIYNRVRLGLLRADLPLRLPLTGLRGMDMVLDQQTWICLDRTFYDLPVLAWTDFEPTARTGLQDPVTCRILYYHVHADFIVHSVLSTTVHALRERAAHMARASDRPADTFGPRVISLSTHPEDFRA